jgi:bifunctional non-homologous end joining protein LigD
MLNVATAIDPLTRLYWFPPCISWAAMTPVRTRFPSWLEPMAATLTQERFAGSEWIFERKFDGVRLLAFKQGDEVRLLSRNQLPQNASYPALVRAVAALPVHDVILDGEATGVWDGAGASGRRAAGVAYHVFDVLWIGGRDVTALPLDERRSLLAALPMRAPLARVEELQDHTPWERACREGWEGVIAKRRDAPYEHRRSPHWLKMKCEATQELVVGGFTDPQGGRVGLGALLVGYFEDGHLAFAGKVGTGFDNALLRGLRARLDALEVPATPFTRAVGLPRLRAHWVKPEIVVQVAFTEWTVHGKLRHPRLLGVRTDKRARDVVREAPQEPSRDRRSRRATLRGAP